MFQLARVMIRDFRGFTTEQEFQFDEPVVLLCGENHRGKSSTLNAVEWCLFGDDCVGTKTGMRERVDWEIRNRYVQEGTREGTRVIVELTGPDGTYTITREQARGGGRGSGAVTVTPPHAPELRGAGAERELYRLLRCSFQDFMATVYQHQEAIRFVVTQEPRQRNEAMDRLLGLSEYRELLKGIDGGQLEKTQKAIDAKVEEIRIRAEQSISTIDNLVREGREKVLEAGLTETEVTKEGAIRRAREIAASIRSLARDLGVADLQVRSPAAFEDIEEFRDWAKTQPDDLWALAPDVLKQVALAGEEQRLGEIKGRYEAANDEGKKASEERGRFIQEHGDAATLARRANEQETAVADIEKRIHEVNERANLVREAVQYLTASPTAVRAGRCPLCQSEAPDLLAHLEAEWEEKISKEVEDLEGQREAHSSKATNFRVLEKQIAGLDTRVERATSALKLQANEVAAALQREIGSNEDPGALVNARLRDIRVELESLQQAIQQKGQRRVEIYDQLAKLRSIHEILTLEEKRAIIEAIWDSDQFIAVEGLRDRASQLVEDASAIRASLAAASREEAQTKINAAGAALNSYFTRLTQHPTIRSLTIEVTQDTRGGLNSYVFKSKDGSDPTPILSQGDLNCLALSLFLGLAETLRETQPFAFLMMDDPTQSLGPEMKRQLVDVLEGMAALRKLIIATPDPEFEDFLMSRISKRKVEYSFLGWTEKGGPKVSKTTS